MSEIHIHLLKEAKKQLKTSEFICIAVNRACEKLYDIGYERSIDSYKITHKETYDILVVIADALGNFNNVGDWLDAKGIYTTGEEMYNYRQQWLDQMIEYWRDKP